MVRSMKQQLIFAQWLIFDPVVASGCMVWTKRLMEVEIYKFYWPMSRTLCQVDEHNGELLVSRGNLPGVKSWLYARWTWWRAETSRLCACPAPQPGCWRCLIQSSCRTFPSSQGSPARGALFIGTPITVPRPTSPTASGSHQSGLHFCHFVISRILDKWSHVARDPLGLACFHSAWFSGDASRLLQVSIARSFFIIQWYSVVWMYHGSFTYERTSGLPPVFDSEG